MDSAGKGKVFQKKTVLFLGGPPVKPTAKFEMKAPQESGSQSLALKFFEFYSTLSNIKICLLAEHGNFNFSISNNANCTKLPS